MAKARSETISLKGEPLLKEGAASAAISPGHFVEFGGTKDIRKQSTAQANARRAIALENDLEGKGITVAYAANSNVRYGSFHPGQEAQVRVAAAAPAIVKGDALELAGDGTVRKLTGSGNIIAFALEAIDNSSGSSEVWINLEIA